MTDAEDHRVWRKQLAPGVFAPVALARSSPEWQAAYRLSKDSSTFNRWRGESGGRGAPYLELRQFTLERLNLAKCRFMGVNLSRARFVECNLRGAEFAGVSLNGATFVNCRLRDANFRQARLARTVFDGLDLTGCDFYESIRAGWSIEGVSCDHAWINTPREPGEPPEEFDTGQFEGIYGGTRFTVMLPDGITSIDLLAVPFYLRRLAEQGIHDVTLSSVQIAGKPGLEFRTAKPNPQREFEVQRSVEESARYVRDAFANLQDTAELQRNFIELLVSSVRDRDHQIDRLLDLSARPTVTFNNAQGPAIALATGADSSAVNVVDASNTQAVLTELRNAKIRLGSATESHEIEVLTQLEDALTSSDPEIKQSFFRRFGRQALDIAKQIGSSVLEDYLKKQLGL